MRITAGTRSANARMTTCAKLWLAGIVGLTGLTGCARSLTIKQAPFINTAMHVNRAAADRTGEPLEVNIVCVYPSDMEKPQNAALSPDANITADTWYKHRPRAGQTPGAGGFDLPAGQIYLLTDDRDVYGKAIGKRLRGAKQDGRESIKISPIKFRESGWGNVTGSTYSRSAVIYVFPRFIGRDGQVLPVSPAKFHPPGSYPKNMMVEIGVDDPGGSAQQFIRIIN